MRPPRHDSLCLSRRFCGQQQGPQALSVTRFAPGTFRDAVSLVAFLFLVQRDRAPICIGAMSHPSIYISTHGQSVCLCTARINRACSMLSKGRLAHYPPPARGLPRVGAGYSTAPSSGKPSVVGLGLESSARRVRCASGVARRQSLMDAGIMARSENTFSENTFRRPTQRPLKRLV